MLTSRAIADNTSIHQFPTLDCLLCKFVVHFVYAIQLNHHSLVIPLLTYQYLLIVAFARLASRTGSVKRRSYVVVCGAHFSPDQRVRLGYRPLLHYLVDDCGQPRANIAGSRRAGN